MNFEHKGYVIGVTVTGQFVATVNGAEVVKKSLEAMKGFIDGNIKTGNAAKFTEFQSLHMSSRGDLGRIAVTGVTKSRKSYGPKYFFALNSTSMYGREVNEIVPDTPENEAAMLAAHTYLKESEAIEREREKVQATLNAKIKRITATEHAIAIGVR